MYSAASARSACSWHVNQREASSSFLTYSTVAIIIRNTPVILCSHLDLQPTRVTKCPTGVHKHKLLTALQSWKKFANMLNNEEIIVKVSMWRLVIILAILRDRFVADAESCAMGQSRRQQYNRLIFTECRLSQM